MVKLGIPIAYCAVALLALLSACAEPSPDATGALRPERLRCEYLTDPLGIDAERPRLGWVIAGTRRGARQTAYQIQAASSLDALAGGEPDLHDSGKVASAESTHVRYGGPALSSRDAVYWRVRIWDESDAPTPWSQPARWTMGLLDAAAWAPARWVSNKYAPVSDARTPFRSEGHPFDDSDSAAVYMRREFAIDKPVARATASVSGLGY